MWSPAVSPWFVSLLLLSYSFPTGNYTDLEVARDGTVWVLMEGRPELYALLPSGEYSRFYLDGISLPSGLALDGTGGILVADGSRGTITIFDRRMQPVSTFPVPGSPGDLVISGLSIWYIDTDRESVKSTTGVVLARGAPASGRLFHHRGTGLLAGNGLSLVSEGAEPVRLSSRGTGCLAGDRVLILSDSILFYHRGDTLMYPVGHSRVSSSPDGTTIILWGRGGAPVVVE